MLTIYIHDLKIHKQLQYCRFRCQPKMLMMHVQMLELCGKGRVFTVKVQNQAHNVIMIALKPEVIGTPVAMPSGKAIRQVRSELIHPYTKITSNVRDQTVASSSPECDPLGGQSVDFAHMLSNIRIS